MNLFSIFHILLVATATFGKTGQEKCSPEDQGIANLADRNTESVKVLVYKVGTKIRLRYSETTVTTILQNTHLSKMAYYPWKVILPKLAFLSAFHFFYVSLEFNAIQGTISVKNQNQSRGVSMWVRNANLFSVDLQIRPLSEVQASISYGEVLERNLGYYQQNVYILPDIVQSAKSLIITTEIQESDEIKFVRIPFNIQDAAIVHKTTNHTKVVWNPDVYKVVNPRCSVSQYSVQYDVWRNRGGIGGGGNGNENSGLDYDGDGDDDNGRNGTKKRPGSGNKNGANNGIAGGGAGGTLGITGGGGGTLGSSGAGGGGTPGSSGGGGAGGSGGKGGNSGDGSGKGGGSGGRNGTSNGTGNGNRNGTKFGETVNSGDIVVISNYLFHFLVPVDLKSLRKHLIFIQDISGSMNGRKIEQMKAAMTKTLSDLRPDDYFNIITFNGAVKHWKTDSSTIAADSTNITRAKDFVKTLEAGGRTAIKGSLEEAFKLINDIDDSQTLPDNVKSSLVFMTDGLPTDANTTYILANTQKLNKNLSVSIHALGFGNEADMNFLKALALQNFGLSRQIFEGADAGDQLKSFYNEISTPVLTDVTITYNSPDFTITGLSITNFTTVFGGKEIKVTGKIVPKVPGRGPFTLTVTIKGNSRRGPVLIKKIVSLLLSAEFANSFNNKENTVENTTGVGGANQKRKQTKPGQTGNNGGRNNSTSNNRGSGGNNRNSSGGTSGSSGNSQLGSPNRQRNKFQYLPNRGSAAANGEEDYVNKIWTQITMQQLIDSYLATGNSSILDEIRKMALQSFLFPCIENLSLTPVASQNGIVTPYTSMTTRFSGCSPKVLLDPLPIEAFDGTNCSFGNIVQPLESIRWFNPKLPSVKVDGVVYNISQSRYEIDTDSVPGDSCTVKTKTTYGKGSCQHLLDCPQTDFKDSLDVYKNSYFCTIKFKRSRSSFFAGVCCLSKD